VAAKHFLIGGAGFSGAVLARQLAEAGHHCQIIETRSHVAGHCHTKQDADTGIWVHVYGPHIFHTDQHKVWAFVNDHAQMIPYRHRVFSHYRDGVYALPINLHTINQFFNKSLSPQEAQDYIQARAEKPSHGGAPQHFEEQALAFVGRELYEAFFQGYTRKQWGIDPKALPASILKRLPLRFIYDDNYFFHPFQAIPQTGYTAMVSSILDHPRIELVLEHSLTRGKAQADHIFFTGTIDGWFDYEEGRLAYRTLDFKTYRQAGSFQGCPVMNYPSPDIDFTRITEAKYFTPWQTYPETIYMQEFSRTCGVGDIPSYPVRLVEDQALLATYLTKARAEKNVRCLGRLGTYRYLDMDVAISEAMEAAQQTWRAVGETVPIPSLLFGV